MKRLHLSRHQLAPLLLLALCVGLAGVIYVELDQPPIDAIAKAAPSPSREPAGSSRDSPGFSMPPLRGYAEVLERPLFSETRRPSVAAAAPVDPRSADFTLVGIVISAHERHALIQHGQPPRLERVSEGQDIDGWAVESIKSDRVVLTRADQRLEVKAKDGPALQMMPNQPRRPTGANVPPVDPNVAFGVQPGINLTGVEANPAPAPIPARPRRQR